MTMNFYFCESCGKRVTDKELGVGGAARNIARGETLCPDCTSNTTTMETEAIRHLPPSPPSPDVPKKLSDPVRIAPTKRSPGSQRGMMPAAPQKSHPRPHTTPQRPMWVNALIAVGLVFAGGAVVYIFKPAETRTSASKPPTQENKVATARPTPQPPPTPLSHPATTSPLETKPADAPKLDSESVADAAFDELEKRINKLPAEDKNSRVAAYQAFVKEYPDAIVSARARVALDDLLNPKPEKPFTATIPTATPTPAPVASKADADAQALAKQVDARLRELNPGYDGNGNYTIEHGQITRLFLSSESIRDLTPLSGLPELGSLRVQGVGQKKCKLSSLAPLKGLRLSSLGILNTDVEDLSPIAGMPIGSLDVYDSPVKSLAPLKGMGLAKLDIRQCPISDLSPLQGMDLTELTLRGTLVSDLSPLKGMRSLSLLMLNGSSGIKDLSPLAGMTHLQSLYFNGTSVTDLTPLKQLPIETMRFDVSNHVDYSVLRNMPKLKSVNDRTVEQFFAELSAGTSKK
jgi:Leucine-rich repeat (LRR) protein